MQFLNPHFLWLALGAIVMTMGLFAYQRKNPPVATRSLLFQGLALVLLWLALARPQGGQQQVTQSAHQSQVLFAMDVSQSMLATDVKPSRLVFSVIFVQKLIAQLAQGQLALFPFAADGYLQIPFTSDHRLFNDMLPLLNPKITTQQGSDLERTLESLLKKLTQDPKALSSHSTSVVLLSDGESHADIDVSLLHHFKEKGIVIHTVGIGGQKNTTIPQAQRFFGQDKYLKDESGKTVYTKLEKAPLELIAQTTEGRYFEGHLSQVSALASLLSSNSSATQLNTEFVVTQEYFPFFILFAFILLAFEFSQMPWYHTLRGLVVFLLFSSTLIPKVAVANTAGWDEKELSKLPPEQRAHTLYNFATELEAQQDFKRANSFYQESLMLTEDEELKKRIFFNSGNISMQVGEMKEALESYQKAFDEKIDNPEANAQFNRKISENMVLAMQIQKQQSKEGESSDKPGDGQGKGGKPQDPKGPQNKYEKKSFSEKRKEKLYKLIASEEQKALERLHQNKLNEKAQNYRGKPW